MNRQEIAMHARIELARRCFGITAGCVPETSISRTARIWCACAMSCKAFRRAMKK